MSERLKQELEIIKESVLQTVPNTEAIYLFGSHANGASTADSDLDIYVVIPDSIEENPLNVSAAILHKLYPSFPLPVDMLVGKRNVFDKRKEWAGTIQKTIATKGVLIYGE